MEIRQQVDCGRGEELTIQGHEGTFWNDENVYVNFGSNARLLVKAQQTVHTCCVHICAH